MIIVTLVDPTYFPTSGCSISAPEYVLVKIDATGNQTTTCIPAYVNAGALIALNQELNSIVSQGYQLIETNFALDSDGGDGGLVHNGCLNEYGVTFIFAIP